MAKEGKGKKGDTIKHTPETHSLPCKLNTEQIAEAALSRQLTCPERSRMERSRREPKNYF